MSAENEIRNIKLFEEEIRNIKQMAFDAAHPVNETYTQYPQQDDPMTLYNKDGVTSVWEIQAQYSGAFFRSSNAPTFVYKADDEDQYYTQDSVTGGLVPTNVAANGGPSIAPTPTPGQVITIEGKTYKGYAVTASSRNAADYIDKTGVLTKQSNQNAYHSHTISGGSCSASGDTGSGGSHTHYLGYGATRTDGYGYMYQGTSPNWSPVYTSEDGSHSHSVSVTVPDHSHSCSSNGSSSDRESRPDNFTYIIWKRIA